MRRVSAAWLAAAGGASRLRGHALSAGVRFTETVAGRQEEMPRMRTEGVCERQTDREREKEGSG
jgi:hypothetical protein